MDFNDFYWHDAVILNITIDRNDPGRIDTILFEIEFPDIGKVNFSFDSVYWIKMNLNFGIIASESILTAFIAERSDPDFVFISSTWEKFIDNTTLDCYVIELNSTGGEIKIIATGFRIE
jgi:hypothetical protein